MIYHLMVLNVFNSEIISVCKIVKNKTFYNFEITKKRIQWHYVL